MAPTLFYFPIRGRGEPIRLCLAAADVDFVDAPVDREALKTDRRQYPFGQAPRFTDDDGIDMTQSNAIVRHLGRKHGMYGATRAEQAAVDQLIDGVEDIKGKYLKLIYQDAVSDEAKAAYWTTHVDAATVAGSNGGAHFTFLADLLKRTGAEGFAVGSKLSIADIMLFDIVDMHIRIFADEFTAAYPTLAALHANVAAVPGVAAYLASDRRPAMQNGRNLG